MAETSTNAQENKQRRVTDWENYHPLPMHRHIGSYKLFVSLLIVAYLLIGIGLTLFPETAVTLSTNGLMLPIALPIIPVVVWLVWSYVVHDRYIQADTVLLGDDRISAGYTIRHDGEVGDTSH